MKNKNVVKYKKYPVFKYENRTWPNKELLVPPSFCSVDLRDGNQSLPNPMGINMKIKFFSMLVKMGFKEIEIGFPSASDTEYNFLRRLIEEDRIPDDVTVQVLVQARESLIRRTFEALKGAKKAIVHVYNSVSVAQREMVFKMTKEEIKEIAINGAKLLNDCAKEYPGTDYKFQYSPESFTGTETDYALEVCEAVLNVWKPTPQHKAIINLPATVEMTSPNVFADQIEWFCKNLSCRDCVEISLHAHNDRGTGVAATELGVLAGADRVEGTLFGNGERTGNLDILTFAMNYYSQGIDPGLYLEDMKQLVETYEECTGMTVHERHPYAGKLVYTAFSGSHQDAINKGLKVYKERNEVVWDIPYLPINPTDIGRIYEPIIRINSQSGKGGIAFVLEEIYGYQIPKGMQTEVSQIIQTVTDELGKELNSSEIYEIFDKEFVNLNEPNKLYHFSYSYDNREKDSMIVNAKVCVNGIEKEIEGRGNGPVSAFFNAVKPMLEHEYKFVSYNEHALSQGADAEAAAYVAIEREDGVIHYGTGLASNIDSASIWAIMGALNRFDN